MIPLNFSQYQQQVSDSCFGFGQSCVSQFEKACNAAIQANQLQGFDLFQRLLLIMAFTLFIVSMYCLYLKWQNKKCKKEIQTWQQQKEENNK